MTIKDCLAKSTIKFEQAGISSARLDAELILTHVLGKDRVWLLANNDVELTKHEISTSNKLIDQRLTREPISYITNHKEFYGLDFYVDSRVLTPRDETEPIVDEVIKKASNGARIIDIGTGSGALAVSIASHRSDLVVSATEVSEAALEVAKINASKILGDNHSINMVKSDLFNKIVGQFDIIIANLPYVSNDYKSLMMAEVKHEPEIALFGGSGDGLDLYRKFFKSASSHLNADGLIYLESDPWQHQELIKLATKSKLELIFQDYLILGFVLKTS